MGVGDVSVEFVSSALVSVVSIFSFGVDGVVVVVVFCLLGVSVDGAFIFVGDGQGIFQADSDLQCRMRVCARKEDLSLGLLGVCFVGFVRFS